jgi:hypothetical protein
VRTPIELLNAHFDGKVLSEDEARSLSSWVGEDPDNARTVVELGIIHSQADYWLSVPRFLDELGDSEDPAIKKSIDAALETIEIDSYRKRVGVEPRTRAGRKPSWGWVAAAVAASLLIAVVSFPRGVNSDNANALLVVAPVEQAAPKPIIVEPAPVVATITETINLESRSGSRLRRGKYILRGESLIIDAGVLALTTADGCDVVVEGPAKLVFEDSQQIAMTKGRLSARIDEGATGMVVKTPTARVVDLGTEFGVGIGPDLATDVAVYDGVVELYSARSDKDSSSPSKRITAGRAGHVDAKGSLNFAVQTLPNDREFIRPDEIASLRKARSGSAEASQQTCFYALQRTRGLMAFQSFDIPSEGSAYSVAFRETPPRSATSPTITHDLQSRRLYSSGALLVGEGEHAFLDIDTSSDSPLARAKLLTDRGQIGRSGAELWIAWKTRMTDANRTGDHAGMSMMFGDQRLMQEPLFVGYSGGKQTLAVASNVGSRTVELELDADPDTFAVDPIPLDTETHQWVMQIIFGERGDKVAVWCDVPPSEIRTARPHAETVNANLIFDRLRLGVSRDASAWLFDDIVMATSIDAIAEVQELQAANAARR